jgi:rare lipoprotein A
MTRRFLLVACAGLLAFFTGCGSGTPRFTAAGISRSTPTPGAYDLTGVASYYAEEFNGRTTSSGEVFDMNDLTAAHRTLPFNTLVKVTNLESQLAVTVRINDRGPFKDDRIIDLSYEAARRIGMIPKGTAPVRLEILEIGQTAQ